MSDDNSHAPAPPKHEPAVFSDREMLLTLRRLTLGDRTVGRRTFEQRRSPDDPSAPLYERRFGSWTKALERAGLDTCDQPEQLRGATTR